MRRSPRVLLAWTAVVVVALLTARIVAGDLTTLHRRARSLGPDVHVVVAARDLALGATLAAGDIRIVVRPAATVAPDALRDANAAVGRVVRVALLRDDVVRARHLANARAPGLDAVVTEGRRAVHVSEKDGYRPPVGAIVDVLATFDPTSVSVTGPPGRALLVARGALVLAADDPAGSGDAPGSGVTLLVTAAETSAVAYAAAIGQITLALAPPETACCTPSRWRSCP